MGPRVPAQHSPEHCSDLPFFLFCPFPFFPSQGMFSVLVLAWLFLPIYIAAGVGVGCGG